MVQDGQNAPQPQSCLGQCRCPCQRLAVVRLRREEGRAAPSFPGTELVPPGRDRRSDGQRFHAAPGVGGRAFLDAALEQRQSRVVPERPASIQESACGHGALAPQQEAGCRDTPPKRELRVAGARLDPRSGDAICGLQAPQGPLGSGHRVIGGDAGEHEIEMERGQRPQSRRAHLLDERLGHRHPDVVRGPARQHRHDHVVFAALVPVEQGEERGDAAGLRCGLSRRRRRGQHRDQGTRGSRATPGHYGPPTPRSCAVRDRSASGSTVSRRCRFGITPRSRGGRIPPDRPLACERWQNGPTRPGPIRGESGR